MRVYFAATLKVALLLILCCNPTTDIKGASVDVLCNNNWVFDDSVAPSVELVFTSEDRRKGDITVDIQRDTKEHYLTINKRYKAKKGVDKIDIDFDLDPGFYKVDITVDNELIKSYNIGYAPTEIVSDNDSQSDLESFWAQAKAELAKVDPEYEMERIEEKSSVHRDLFLVKMRSLGGALVQAYLAMPTNRSKKYPVYIEYQGYGGGQHSPSTNYPSERIDILVSTRGQGINRPNNTYGEWITYGLESEDGYYYRGAFMDVIRAIDFVYQLPECDIDNIFAYGISQGGALTLVAASLDDRIKAAAPAVPFLSDYPDYFRIVNWPANVVKEQQHRLGISDEDLYKTLSYFDVKNLTHLIKCPVMMYVGLQDPICPPHTNFSGYNHIKTDKEYIINPYGTHSINYGSLSVLRDDFFNKYISK